MKYKFPKEGLVLKSYFNNTSHQQILTFLSNHPGRSYFDKEVKEATGLSTGAANQALRELAKEGYIEKESKGRMVFYSVDLSNPVIRQFKVLLNITTIYSLILDLTKYCNKIVLFGSAATGTNIEESDIDLFVLTTSGSEVTRRVRGDDLAEQIQLVIKKPVEMAALKRSDPIFFEEIERGITLWEAK